MGSKNQQDGKNKKPLQYLEHTRARDRAYDAKRKDVKIVYNAKYYAEHPVEELARASTINRLMKQKCDNRTDLTWLWVPSNGSVELLVRRALRLLICLQEQWEEILERSNYRCCYCPDDCKACRRKTHKFQQEHLTPVVDSGNYTVKTFSRVARSAMPRNIPAKCPSLCSRFS